MSKKPMRAVAKPLFAAPITKKSATTVDNNLLTELHDTFRRYYFNQDYANALPIALQALKIVPNNITLLSDIATCYIYLNDFEQAIKYALKTIALDPKNINAYDALAHAYGETKDRQKVSHYGLIALQLRDEKYGKPLPHLPYTLIALPPPPSLATKANNIISFSLFGGLPKYCETAILNAEYAKVIYPNWTCHFYVDDSVPNHVKQRLQQHHAQVIPMLQVQKSGQNKSVAATNLGNIATAMSPTMWRFLALDDSQAHRVLFRDADSLIGQREALAVADWVQSGKYFHMMRDSYTHTELILAGMWGAVAGVLTQQKSLAEQLLAFMQSFNGNNQHFADQFFLRDTQWQTVKTSLLQHDSYFGFLGANDFPTSSADTAQDSAQHNANTNGNVARLDENRPIGSNISGGYFETLVRAKDNDSITWQMQLDDNRVLGEYQTPAKEGKIRVFFPKILLEKINAKTLKIVLK